jgi:hypothetical protein
MLSGDYVLKWKGFDSLLVTFYNILKTRRQEGEEYQS